MSRRELRPEYWGLIVYACTAVVTAHGMYHVAHASQVPRGLAYLYPILTDGLGVVSYLTGTDRRLYASTRAVAWLTTCVAVALSAVAQGVVTAGLDTGPPPPDVRFGVGAWPAVAAILTGVLLHAKTHGHLCPYPLGHDQARPASVTPSDGGHPTRVASNGHTTTVDQTDVAAARRRAIQATLATGATLRETADRHGVSIKTVQRAREARRELERP